MAACVTHPAWAVIIKGTPEQANETALALNLELRDVTNAPAWRDVRATVNAPERVMQEWFNRDAGQRHPLPAGALLHFWCEEES